MTMEAATSSSDPSNLRCCYKNVKRNRLPAVHVDYNEVFCRFRMTMYSRTNLAWLPGILLIWIWYDYREIRTETPAFFKPKVKIVHERRMKQIKNHLVKACTSLKDRNISIVDENATSKNNLPIRLVASDNFKLIGCKITKVGSTNMARLLYALDHLSETNDTNKVSKGRARKLTIDTTKKTDIVSLQQKLMTYTTYMFVRDPFERLLSAYRDERPTSWFKKNISFSKYLQFVIAEPINKLNKHLTPIYIRCKPCTTRYDFVGLLKNFDGDMKRILESVGAGNVVHLPQRNQTGYQQQKSSDVLHRYMKTVSVDIRKQIYEKYYIDYFLFGFAKPF